MLKSQGIETRIKETEGETPIVVGKFKFTCDDADPTIPKPLPQMGGFAMLIVGKPRSGKTNLLLNLTTKAHKNFNRKFDRVYLWSPSVHTMENDPFELLPEDQKFEER
jgi:stage III sporulation protein SpoIIIAA